VADPKRRKRRRDRVGRHDKRIAAELRELEAGRRYAIRQLGTPSWKNIDKLVSVLEQRLALEARWDLMEDIISAGDYFRLARPPFSLGELEVERQADIRTPTGDWGDWEDFADALKRGVSPKNKKFAPMLKTHKPPEYVQKLIEDRETGKTKFPRGRPREALEDRRARSKPLKANEYYQQIRPILREMYYPEQKLAEINRRASEITASKYGIEEDTLHDFRQRPKEDDRRFTGKPRPKPKSKSTEK
jgi:hypothetical protein